MTDSSATSPSPELDAETARLDWKFVGDISGRFVVARYQRGYRWGVHEVGRLLSDIWNSKGSPYSLQPVVVKQEREGVWELVDGQQRLTTLYLIFLFMQREGLKNVAPAYSITYETRPGSEEYLQKIDPERSEENIDYFHLHGAYECIRVWFAAHGARRQYVADKFYTFLFESVRVIWYQAPAALDSTTLFTRLNVGRIPLTDAELIKALLLSRSHASGGRADRAFELAAQWDGIERDLRNPDMWAFITDERVEAYPTRITLLLDAIAGGPHGPDRPRFQTFDTLQEKVANSPGDFWNAVVDLHSLVLGWYENRDHYHKIGYLVVTGHLRLERLVELARGETKSHFEALLDNAIREGLNMSPSDVTSLSYESDSDRARIELLLLLMNVETVRRVQHSAERFPFRLYVEGAWSLEHIHAQNADSLTKVEQWKEWLRLHRAAIEKLPSLDPERIDALVARVDAAPDRMERENFQEIAREITAVFTADQSGSTTLHSMHSVSNMALISCDHNSALGNSVFEVKRRLILELDKKGEYIPVCTRHLFLKYYTDSEAQQIHFWSTQDRERYLEAMISQESGVVFPYLRPENRES